jgi:hypothetical protein
MLEKVDNNCAGIRRRTALLEKRERVTLVWEVKLCQWNKKVGCNSPTRGKRARGYKALR